MRALILSAGIGTRLKPLTDKMPKVMIRIGGKPLLWHHIQLLKKHGIKNIWINLHWHPETIKNCFGDGSQFGVKITYSYEPKLLGTAGALKNPLSGIEKEFQKGSFLVVYGDNLTNFNYSDLVKLHKFKKPFVSISLYISDEPWNKGVVETNPEGRVIKIIEKPPKDKMTSSLVNAGIYLCEAKILDYIPQGFSDFGFDIFPKLLQNNLPIYALPPKYYVEDIGTKESLKKARKMYSKLNS